MYVSIFNPLAPVCIFSGIPGKPSVDTSAKEPVPWTLKPYLDHASFCTSLSSNAFKNVFPFSVNVAIQCELVTVGTEYRSLSLSLTFS